MRTLVNKFINWNCIVAMATSCASSSNRGALIVFEGLDRCGKTTQSSKLVKFLEAHNVPVRHMSCPNRELRSGKLINEYLTNKADMSDESIHLLFAVNRWEMQHEMRKLLNSGTTLVVDRYSYSGVAYSAAKGLDIEWCRAPERNLIRPDIVFFLSSLASELADRKEYGTERYERIEFQEKVAKAFKQIYEEEKNYWKVLDATAPIDTIFSQISDQVLKVIRDSSGAPLNLLWQ